MKCKKCKNDSDIVIDYGGKAVCFLCLALPQNVIDKDTEEAVKSAIQCGTYGLGYYWRTSDYDKFEFVYRRRRR